MSLTGQFASYAIGVSIPVSDWHWAKNNTDYHVKIKMKLMNLKNHNENMNLKFI